MIIGFGAVALATSTIGAAGAADRGPQADDGGGDIAPPIVIYGAPDSFLHLTVDGDGGAATTATSSGHSVTAVELAGFDVPPGAGLWFPTISEQGKVVMATMTQEYSQFSPRSNATGVLALDPSVPSAEFVPVQTTGGATQMPTATDVAAHRTEPGGRDISDLCNVVGSDDEERIMGITAYPNTNYERNFYGQLPMISLFNDDGTDNTAQPGTMLDFEPRSPATGTYSSGSRTVKDLESEGSGAWASAFPTASPYGVLQYAATDNDPNNDSWPYDTIPAYPNVTRGANECAVLPNGDVVVVQYFGGILVLSPDGVVKAFLDEISYGNPPAQILRPREVKASPTGSAGDYRFVVIYDFENFPLQEFTYNSTGTPSITPRSKPVLAPAKTGGVRTFGFAEYDAVGRLLVTTQFTPTGNYLPNADQVAVYNVNRLNAVAAYPPSGTPSRPFGAVAPNRWLADASASPSYGTSGTPLMFNAILYDAPADRFVLVNADGMVRMLSWDDQKPTTAPPGSPTAYGGRDCDIDSGSYTLETDALVRRQVMQPRNGVIHPGSAAVDDQSLYLALGSGRGRVDSQGGVPIYLAVSYDETEQFVVEVPISELSEAYSGSCPDGTTAGPFPDVAATNSAVREVEWGVAEGITNGYADGDFHPGDAVSRQAAAAFLYRLAGEPAFTPPSTPTFNDVSTSHTFFTEIEWAADQGLVAGYADGGFHSTSGVSRQAIAAFMYRFADGTSAAPDLPTIESECFTDVTTSHQFYDEIVWTRWQNVTLRWAEALSDSCDPSVNPVAPDTAPAASAQFRSTDTATRIEVIEFLAKLDLYCRDVTKDFTTVDVLDDCVGDSTL